jgi:DNA-binding response OmpR family regulator
MSRIRVLYVEDELFLGKIVKESLETRGFEVVMEDDGARVLDLFINETPDICVLDVMLPHKSGFEIAGEIRKLNDDVPVIFLTAKTQAEDVVQGFKLGGNDYIRKPFSMEELIVRIEHALRVKRDIPGDITTEVISLGKYQYNINRHLLQNGPA